ncbi:MAG: hybrid sensor histidine kinase/response regulator [Bacteroidales bacterium]|jgi:two-component system sensor histidine kinase/response regulator|nr:hybrid sensor histidine kinase/response regulator [Bacteroidales bacterium]
MNEESHKILIVDDLPKNIQVVANTLQPAGYNISFAQNGENALDLCYKHDFDLILLDIMMPGMDGIEVCRRLKSDPQFKNLPIIFLTAKNDIESITQAFEAGGVDYVSKPFKGAELSARVKTHLTLKKQKETLQQLNATKDKFFSIIAHDLKSPFTGLLGFAELLIEESDTAKPEELKQYYQLLYKSAKQGFDLLSSLLEWSQTQSSSIKFSPDTYNLCDIIQENINLLSNIIHDKKIRVKCNIDKKLKVNADANMLKTIIRNLISNALKFTNPGGEIQLNATSDLNYTQIEVRDNGIGMDEKTMNKLFRLDENSSRKGTNNETGTGLGLIICKEFIQQHNGEIWVESEMGKGSSFFFSLPKLT